MSISIHIERLVLDGLPLQPGDGTLLQATVEAEVSRLFSEGGIPGDLQHSGNQARVSAPVLHLNSTSDAKLLGVQLGEGIYSAVAGQNRRS